MGKALDGGEIQMCGWLKDKFGVSWQIIPYVLGELMNNKDPEKSKRVMQSITRQVAQHLLGMSELKIPTK